MEKKVRVEIIYSQALDEDFISEFNKAGIVHKFTKFNNVTGAGYNNPHLGDDVWPQLNMMYLIFCSEDEAEKIKEIVLKLREMYKTEGISCFISSAEEI
ncbi:MAG: hypothetical protein J6X11_00455 [Treponema sp.]|nr:hypothetical protein [Treponema sp.]